MSGRTGKLYSQMLDNALQCSCHAEAYLILATHAIVGAAIASQIPNHPVIALLAGIASHFAIDAIPHWDYPLRSIRSRANKGSPLTLDKGFLVDLSLIALDGLAGLTLAFSLFAQPGSLLTILLGALGGILPDPLRFVYRLYPDEPLRTVQRFHNWIHAKQKLAWPFGIASQFAFNVAVILLAGELQNMST